MPCTFELDVPGLGYLENSPAETLKSGTEVSLPLWLGEQLALADLDEERAYASPSMPPALSDQVMQALRAGPASVPLRDQSAHFYALASRLLDLLEDAQVAAVLKRAFVARAAEVGMHARKAGASATDSTLGAGGGGEEFLRGLDEWERKLFRKAHDGTRATKAWMDSVKKH